MRTYTLSPRLKTIADFAKNKKIVADIGCDHGKITVYLAEHGAYVHAVDISEPSLQKARGLAQIEGAGKQISFYVDDGLNSIKNVDLDTVIIAGMGWRMIKGILESNLERVKKIDSLILQPMDSVIELRDYLCGNSFNIFDEKLVWDEGRLYTVIVAKYGSSQKLNLRQLLLGPKIIENNDELLYDLVEKELKKREAILSGLTKAKTNKETEIIETKQEIEILKSEKMR